MLPKKKSLETNTKQHASILKHNKQNSANYISVGTISFGLHPNYYCYTTSQPADLKQ